MMCPSFNVRVIVVPTCVYDDLVCPSKEQVCWYRREIPHYMSTMIKYS